MQSCPYCRMVRERLDALNLEYDKIEVPSFQRDRKEVFEASGQYTVPVLVVDDDLVLVDEEKILAYLDDIDGKEEE